MNLSKKDLEKILIEKLKDNSDYKTALNLARQNSSGKTWLIGSSVYKTIANALYGSKSLSNDFDFIVESINKILKAPKNWKIVVNRYGNPKFSTKTLIVDLVPLNNIYGVKLRKLKPTIENYLTVVPVSVQAIAFDIGKQELIGDMGINSLLTKTVSITDPKAYKDAQDFHNEKYSVEKYAKELGFKITGPVV